MNTTRPKNDSSNAARTHTRRQVNLRVLIATALVLAVGVPAAWGWLRLQAGRNASALVAQADACEKNKDHAGAARFLYRYLKLQPNDAVARARLAGIVANASKSGRGKDRALELYYEALGAADAKDASAIRRQLAQVLLEAGKAKACEDEAVELLEKDSRDPQGWRLLAWAMLAQAQQGVAAGDLDNRIAALVGPMRLDAPPTAVADLFKQALKCDAKACEPEFSVALAQLFRQPTELLAAEDRAMPEDLRIRRADAIVDAMVKAAAEGDRAEQAWLARFRYRNQFSVAGADGDLDRALQAGPDSADVILEAAARDCREAAAARAKDPQRSDILLAKAADRLERLIKLSPSETRAYVRLGEVHLARGNRGDAIAAWRRGLEATGKENLALLVAIAEAQLSDGKAAEAKESIETIGRIIEKYAARMGGVQRQAAQRALELLQAKWCAAVGDHRGVIAAAKPLTLDAAAKSADSGKSTEYYQACILLGNAYAALGEWDLAAAAFEQAAVDGTGAAQARLLAANAWIAGNRPDMAIRCCEKALAAESRGELWLALARARFQVEMKALAGERKWELFDKALAAAKAAKDSPATAWQAGLLELDYLSARSQEKNGEAQKAEMTKVLADLETAAAGEPQKLLALIPACEKAGLADAADRNLALLEAVAPRSAETIVLKARILTLRGRLDEARKVLDAAGSLPEGARAKLRVELARLGLQKSGLAGAVETLGRMSDKDVAAVELANRIADQAIENEDAETLSKCEAKLRAIEGEEGVGAMYCEARRLLLRSQASDEKTLSRVAELHAAIRSRRPGWAKGYELCGALEEVRGNVNAAIEAYEEAMRLGDERLAVLERTIVLLGQANRTAEMERCLTLLQQRGGDASETLLGVEISLAVRRGQFDRAIALAKKAVQRRPDDAGAWTGLGRILLAAGRTAEAEAAFLHAVELAPGDVSALSGLFGYYAHGRNFEQAQATLELIVKNEKLSPVERELAYARGCVLLGEMEKAKASFRKAAQLAPGDNNVQIALAEALRYGSSEDEVSEAEAALRTVIARAPGNAAARRMLAEMLAEQGSEAQWREAQQLLEEAGLSMTSAADRRVQAMLLARRGGKENLAKACEIFEELCRDAKRTEAADGFWLARVYEMAGRREDARRAYAALADRDDAAACHLAACADFLLRSNLAAEAAPLIARLERIAPTDLAVALLKTRLFKASGRAAEIEPYLESLADKLIGQADGDTAVQAALAARIGTIYTDAGLDAAAERWHRRLAEWKPDRYAPLVATLAREGKWAEAVAICAAAVKSDDTSRPAIALCGALLSVRADSAALTAAWPLLEDVLARHSDDVTLLMDLAAVRANAGQNAEAVKLYRQTLKIQPANVLALNNLATLLAETDTKGAAEALECVELAITKVGPQPMLLDTKGMILVQMEKFQEAAELLEQAVAGSASDPRYAFHLAVAYARCGEMERARKAFEAANRGSLSHHVLTAGDRRMFEELAAKLAN